MERHKQVPAKVIVYVDEGIKELVEILNSFDGVSTFESCQGRDGKLAFVYMDYGEHSKPYDDGEAFDQMTHFVSKLIKAFAKYTSDIDSGGYLSNISIEWWGDKRFPFISIEMPHDYIDEVTNILSHVHNEELMKEGYMVMAQEHSDFARRCDK